jgi:hypothetical protein
MKGLNNREIFALITAIGVGVGGLIALLEFLKNKKTKELQQKNAELENKIKQLEILKLSKDLDGVV